MPSVRAWLVALGARHPYELESPLAADVARRGLAGDDGATLEGGTGIAVRVTGDRVLLLTRSMGPRRTWWDWSLDATIAPRPGGSQLSGTVGAPRLTMAFGALWCTGCVAFFVALGATAVAALVSHGVTGARLAGLAEALIPLGFLGCYLGLATLATRVARVGFGDVDALLRRSLAAPAAPTPAMPTD